MSGNPQVDRISVCMATFNGQAFLAQQIDSILVQLEPGDELLVSDDGSSDQTQAILLSYGAALQLVDSTRVGGVVANFSRVLEHASKPLVVLSDQDDVWLPGRLASMRRLLSDVDLVLTNAWIVDENLRPTGRTLFQETQAGPGFWRNLIRRNSFVGCCMGFRLTLLAQALPLPQTTPWHDWLLGLLACANGKVCLTSEPLLLYRRHGGNATATGLPSRNGLWRMLTLRLRVLLAFGACMYRSWFRRRPNDDAWRSA